MIVDVRKRLQITLPKELADKVNIKEGDILEVTESDGSLILTPSVVISNNYVEELKRKAEQYEKLMNEAGGNDDKGEE
jgi:AbrB family looped-hinge helix DNA binding protein